MEIAQLHQLFLNCHSACTDTRKLMANDMFFALKGDCFNGNTYANQALGKGARFAIIDEKRFKTSENTILVTNVLETLQKLAAYHRNYLNTTIIALTGSNGKTTTKELINTVLSKKYSTTATVGNLNNHIGVPLTLLSMNKDTEIGIVEMGANHLKEIELLCSIAKPDYGYITNFGKAHLEGFGSIEGVIKGKSEMYRHLINNHKTIFVNGSDPIQVERTKNANRIIFGDTTDTSIHIHFIDAQPNVSVRFKNQKIESHLIGAYNFNNIAAAIAIGDFFKIDENAIKTAISNYIPKNNRSQIINKGNIKIILDAYNANPSSMQAALNNFDRLQDNSKTAILGDMFELGRSANTEHQNIVNLIEKLTLDNIILIGSNFYETTSVSKKIIKFESFNDFKASFNPSTLKVSTILIKGSRGMALERVLDLW
ncbi:MAG: UDP-N-acetylmuramoyl-tripeptide--D-alanyl-D-alanine ligase [Aestuariibaculum sp.]